MFRISAVVGVLLAASTALADLTCTNLTPKGHKNNNVKVYFYAGDGYSAPTLPANASVGPTWTLSNHSTSTGATFHLKSCTSTSLGLSPQEQSSCSDAGCYHQYTNYVQIINPSTDHCLTTLSYGSSTSATGFTPCNASATNLYQLWESDQQVQYTMNYENLTSYGEVDFNPIDVGQPPQPPLQAWKLSGDDKGIEVIQYMYSQDGVFAELVQA